MSLVETRCFHCDTILWGPGEMFECALCGWWQCEECLEYEDSCPALLDGSFSGTGPAGAG